MAAHVQYKFGKEVVMKNCMLFFVLTILLAACTESPRARYFNRLPLAPGESAAFPYLQAINSWRGHPVKDFIAAWKGATRIVSLPNGNQAYRWLQVEEFRDGIDKVYYDYDKMTWIEESAVQYHLSCVTVMEVNSDGQIVNADTENLYNCERLAAFMPPSARKKAEP
jgi:hypothetical protein